MASCFQEGYLEVMMPLMDATLQHPSRRAEQRAGLTKQAQRRKTIISHQKNREEQEAVFKAHPSLPLSVQETPCMFALRPMECQDRLELQDTVLCY